MVNFIPWLAIYIMLILVFLDIKYTHYFSCCRDGDYESNKSERKTSQKRPNQKLTRKLNTLCLSRMYVDEYMDGHVQVKYITAHTNHQLGATELPFLPLPKSIREEAASKVNKGIPSERILKGMVMLISQHN